MPRFMPIEVKLTADNVDLPRREVTFYAAAFNNRDRQGHRILPGAFTKTINEQHRAGEIKHVRNHEVLIGRMVDLTPDGRGLLCTGHCSKTQAGDDYLTLALDGALTHASIYAHIVRDRARYVPDIDPATGENIETLELSELILVDAGLVDKRSANTLATIVAVKSLGDGTFLDLVNDLEYVVNDFGDALSGERLTAEERRVAKSLLGLRKALDKQGDKILKALLAPDSGTQSNQVAPPRATPAIAETQPDLTALLKSIQERGRIHL